MTSRIETVPSSPMNVAIEVAYKEVTLLSQEQVRSAVKNPQESRKNNVLFPLSQTVVQTSMEYVSLLKIPGINGDSLNGFYQTHHFFLGLLVEESKRLEVSESYLSGIPEEDLKAAEETFGYFREDIERSMKKNEYSTRNSIGKYINSVSEAVDNSPEVDAQKYMSGVYCALETWQVNSTDS